MPYIKRIAKRNKEKKKKQLKKNTYNSHVKFLVPSPYSFLVMENQGQNWKFLFGDNIGNLNIVRFNFLQIQALIVPEIQREWSTGMFHSERKIKQTTFYRSIIFPILYRNVKIKKKIYVSMFYERSVIDCTTMFGFTLYISC